jgi:alkylresorcinol/alkylpyrone synthase
VLDTALRRMDMSRSDINTWIMHPGGRDVLHALETQMGLGRQDLRYSAAVLRDYGNLSSASVYFVMKEALRNDPEAGAWWLSSFGAGLSCHGALLKVA